MEITVSEKKLLIGQKQFNVYSGEIHYFRISYEEWEDRIKKAKSLGLNCISSYIPWIWHEYEEGKFDFEGETLKERNLKKFIELVMQNQMFFIARIGPYVNAELIYDGLPTWLVGKQEIFRVHEDIPHFFSYLDPIFLKYVERWYQHVIKAIAPFKITNGGNIILVQLCNEIGVLNWLNNKPDLSEFANSIYREFLKKKYETIKNLNDSLGTNFLDFEQIKQPNAVKLEDVNNDMITAIEMSEFYKFYFASYFKFLKEVAIRNGVDVPVVANVAQFIDCQDRGRAHDAILTASFFEKFETAILAGDFYPKRIDYDNFHDTIIAVEALKMASRFKNPVLCMEMQAGFLYDRPKIYSTDVDLLFKTCLACEVQGVNYYMFAGGINPDKIGVLGSFHDWQSPISWSGNLRQSALKIKENSVLFNELKDFEKIYQLTVGIYPPYHTLMFAEGKLAQKLKKINDEFFHDGLLRTFCTGNIAFELVNFQLIDEAELQKRKFLVVFSLDWMDKSSQSKLLNYVKNGGKLLLVFSFPHRNINGDENRTFANFIGIKKIIHEQRKFYQYVNFFDKVMPVFSDITTVDVEDVRVVAIYDGKITGFIKNVEKGAVMFLGFGFSQRFDYQTDLLLKALELLDFKPVVKTSPKDVFASAFVSKEDPKHYRVILINYHEEPRIGVLEVDVNGKIFSKEFSLQPREGKMLEIKTN